MRKAIHDPCFGVRPMIDTGMSRRFRRHLPGDFGFANHMETPCLRCMFGNRLMMNAQIVDEYRYTWLFALDYLCERSAFAALVPVDPVLDP